MQTQLLYHVKEGTFFSAVKEKFCKVMPIFKNLENLENLEIRHMQTFAKEHGIMTTPRCTLIESYQGEMILLGMSLLKFYMEEGLVVTRLH